MYRELFGGWRLPRCNDRANPHVLQASHLAYRLITLLGEVEDEVEGEGEGEGKG